LAVTIKFEYHVLVRYVIVYGVTTFITVYRAFNMSLLAFSFTLNS